MTTTAPAAIALDGVEGADVLVATSRTRERVVWHVRLGRQLLALSDLLAAAVALLICVTTGGTSYLGPETVAAILLIVPLSKLVGLYDRDGALIHHTTLEEGPALIHLATSYTLVVWLLSPLLFSATLDHEQVVVLWLTLMAMTLAGRLVVRRTIDHSSPPERCLIIGDDRSASQFAATIARDVHTVDVVGRVDSASWSDPASHRTLPDLLRRHRIDRIVIAPDDAHPEVAIELVRAARGEARVSILPRVLEVVGSHVEFDEIGGVPVLGVRPLRLSRSSLLLKRAFDIAVGGLGLVAALPLLAVAAVAIKLDSGGPVLFRQTRVGRAGRPFAMLKFRTMVDGADAMKHELVDRNEAQGLFKIADDPRITRVGRTLRRLSIDELPQLLNVLGGTMSIVGPRPLIADEDALITGHDRRRLDLTPGMTGHWQILGSARVPLPDMVKIDYLYVCGWSLWTDVKVLLRTVPYVLSRRGQ